MKSGSMTTRNHPPAMGSGIHTRFPSDSQGMMENEESNSGFLPKFCFSREKQGFLSFKGEGHIFDKIFTVIFRGQIKLNLILNDV